MLLILNESSHWSEKRRQTKLRTERPGPGSQPCPWEQVSPSCPWRAGLLRICGEEALPGLEVMLKVTALQHLGAVLGEWAGHRELAEELVDQDAGLLAVLEDQGLAVQGAEVLTHQEVGEADSAVGVSTGSVQRI